MKKIISLLLILAFSTVLLAQEQPKRHPIKAFKATPMEKAAFGTLETQWKVFEREAAERRQLDPNDVTYLDGVIYVSTTEK